MKMRGPLWQVACAAASYTFLIGSCWVLLFAVRATAQQGAPLSLPSLVSCQRTSHPELPLRWRGIFLMLPFNKAQLMLSDIVYDGSIPAMQIRLHGVRSGSADFLVLGNKTYVLREEGSNHECRELGDTGWTPLPRDWLAKSAQCVGSATIVETPVDWWKTPTDSAPLTDWIWFKSTDRSPFRLLFQKPSLSLSIMSSYAMSYQVSFDPLSQSDLSVLAESCRHAKRETQQSPRRALRAVLDAMDLSPWRASAEIKRLLPELDLDCSKAPRPVWPHSFGMTMFLTPLNFHSNPFPTEVRYDWKSRAQRTRMFWPADSPILNEDVLMVEAQGFSVTRKRAGGVQCMAALPGTPRPNWISEAPCACEAVINGTTALTPYGPVQILRCPATEPRMFWAWYTFEGRPMMFMVTPSSGDEPTALITLADYYAWVPGFLSEPSVFQRPAQCRTAQITGHRRPTNEPCRLCHLTPNAPR